MMDGTEDGMPHLHHPPPLGGLGHQVEPALQSIGSMNLLEHHPPKHQEHSGIDEKAIEAPIDLDEPSSSAQGLSGHVTCF
jgi:hypothetical protein